MNKIIYRQLKDKDFKTIMSIMNDSFGLYKYVNNDKILNTLLNAYFQSCLAEKTFGCVAEKNGKVIGVILGQAKSDYKTISHLNCILKSAYYNVVMILQGIYYKNSSRDFKKMHDIYSELTKGKEKDFDGILTLFAVTEECRGFGVGKKLLCELLNYLKAHNTKNIYLYTDSTCNIGFYESQGFKCLGEKTMLITSNNNQTEMDIYAYSYQIK